MICMTTRALLRVNLRGAFCTRECLVIFRKNWKKRSRSGKIVRKRMRDSLPVLSKKFHCVFMDNELIINA